MKVKRRDLFKMAGTLIAGAMAAPLAKYLPKPKPTSLKFSKDAFAAIPMVLSSPLFEVGDRIIIGETPAWITDVYTHDHAKDDEFLKGDSWHS